MVTMAVNGSAPKLSPSLMRAYIKDFSHSLDAAAQKAGVPIAVIQRANRGEWLDVEDTRRILDSARRRLGRVRFEELQRDWTPNPPPPMVLELDALEAETMPVSAPIRVPEEELLTCKKCGESKAVTEFAVRKSYTSSKGNIVPAGKDGLCLDCRRAQGSLARAVATANREARLNGHAAEQPLVIVTILDGDDARVPESLRATLPVLANTPAPSRSESLMAAAVEMERLERENDALRDQVRARQAGLEQAQRALRAALDTVEGLLK